MIIGRIISFLFLASALVGLYRLVVLLKDRQVALYAVFCVLSWKTSLLSVYQIRPDILQVSCIVWGVYYLLLYFSNQRSIFLIMSGLFSGLSFLSLQKVIPIICVMGLFLAIFLYKKRRDFLVSSIVWGVSLVVPLALYVAYFVFLKHGTVLQYIVCNFKFNSLLAPSCKSVWASLLYFFDNYFLADRILWFFVILALSAKKFDFNHICLLFLSLIALIIGCSISCPPQYHLLYVFLFSVFAALGFDFLAKEYKQVLLFLLCIPSLSHLLALRPFSYSPQVNRTSYCSQFLDQQDLVISNNNTYFFYYPASYIWFYPHSFQGLYQSCSGAIEPQLLDIIKQKRPIIIDRYVLKDTELQDVFIRDNYIELKDFPGIFVLKERWEKIRSL